MKIEILKSVDDAIRAASSLKEPEALHFIATAALWISECFRSGGKLLIAGNGGSLCDAMHFAEELTGQFRKIRPALPAIALSDPGHLTCVGNDMGFESVFSRGVEAFGKPGDIFIALTTSGNSQNLLNAVNIAKQKGLKTISFLGKSGGKLRGLSDLEWIVDGFPFSDRIQKPTWLRSTFSSNGWNANYFMRNKILLLGQRLIEKGAWYFAPLSWIWAAWVFCKNQLYDRGWLRQKKVVPVVVSIGNIVAGGTGKTPFVIMAAKAFSHRKVAILSRGYGKIPDEAMLLKRALPEARVYVGKNRVRLAMKAAEDGAELIFLDDGFQYRKLHRDFDLVLMRGDDPFGKGHYLPWGFLRDSPKRLEKADAVFVGGRDFRHVSKRLLDEEEREIPTIEGWKVGLFSGIANPASFKKSVVDLGGEVALEWRLADHEAADPSRLRRFSAACKALGAKALMTTEKDFIKGPKATLPIIFIEIEIEWLEGRKAWEKSFAKIDQAIDNRSL